MPHTVIEVRRPYAEAEEVAIMDAVHRAVVAALRKLYSEIVGGLAALGIPRNHVSIAVRESDAGNWGIRGGRAACDVDLGFNLHV